MATFAERADQARAKAIAEWDRIARDSNLSDAGKRAQSLKVWKSQADEIESLKQQQASDRATRQQALERQVFGLPAHASTSDRMSFRDASDRAAAITDEKQAVALLHRAMTSGDTELARAVVGQAYAEGWRTVADEFKTVAPEQAAPVDELWAMGGRNAIKGAFADAVAFSINKPPALDGFDDYQLAAMAADIDSPVAV